MILAYARTSTNAQNPQLQIDALTAAGADRIFIDQASGTATARPQLDLMLEVARAGDTIMVWRLDRLGRSMKHLIDLVGHLGERDIGLRSLNEQIDTTTANGRFVFTLMAALAAFERELLVERTTAGLQAAKAQGRVGGRPRALTPQATEVALSMHRADKSVADIAAALKVSRATIYRALAST
ncbi:MAG: recombinase family protein [Candidatus Nanopelagicales bacterium]